MSPRDRLKLHISGQNSWRKQAEPEFSCGFIALICTPSCWLSVSARWQAWEGSGGITELLPALCAVGQALCGAHQCALSLWHSPSWSWLAWKDSRTQISPSWMTKAAPGIKASARYWGVSTTKECGMLASVLFNLFFLSEILNQRIKE